MGDGGEGETDEARYAAWLAAHEGLWSRGTCLVFFEPPGGSAYEYPAVEARYGWGRHDAWEMDAFADVGVAWVISELCGYRADMAPDRVGAPAPTDACNAGGRCVGPEGHRLTPEQTAWLTAQRAREIDRDEPECRAAAQRRLMCAGLTVDQIRARRLGITAAELRARRARDGGA